VIQAADDIAHDLKTDPSARSLYEYGTLPGVVNLSKMGALPIRNYTTSLTGDVDMKSWEAPRLREGFDHRGHQCNACGMHHCHMSVIRQGPYKGKIVDEPEGFGDLLAEGVKRASEKLGGEAAKAAIYTGKGASPRGHDHRARWEEMLDTATSSTATMETGNPVHQTELGLPARINP